MVLCSAVCDPIIGEILTGGGGVMDRYRAFMVYSTLRSTPLLLEITALKDVHYTRKYNMLLEITTL